MCDIEKNAGVIASEIVENYIKLGIELDMDYISDKACELAYKIHEKVNLYKHQMPSGVGMSTGGMSGYESQPQT